MRATGALEVETQSQIYDRLIENASFYDSLPRFLTHDSPSIPVSQSSLISSKPLCPFQTSTLSFLRDLAALSLMPLFTSPLLLTLLIPTLIFLSSSLASQLTSPTLHHTLSFRQTDLFALQ